MGAPIASLTACAAPIARLARADCGVVPVGDSLGPARRGGDPILRVTIAMMPLRGQSAAQGLSRGDNGRAHALWRL